MKSTPFILFIFFSSISIAQERPSPYTAVESFFSAFHAKDSIGLQNSFVPKARLLRSSLRNGKAIVEENDLQQFIQAVANRKETPSWEERLGQPIVQQHLNLATVWVPFHFYLADKLSHCGYNSFTLVWDNTAWKILTLIDTGTKDCVEL